MIIANRNAGGLLSLAAVLALAGCGGGHDDSSAEVESPTAAVAAETATEPLASTLRVEPARLDLGTVFTKKSATGSVRLVNTGATPITIQDCKSSCRCATTDCPRGRWLQPGESADLEIKLTAGALPRTMNKFVSFRAVGQRPVNLPVSVEVIAYVMIDPFVINPEKVTNGRVVIRANDGQPFRITNMIPPVIEAFAPEASLQHELFLDWDVWRELGESRRLVFNVDHPESSQVSISVRATPVGRTDT